MSWDLNSGLGAVTLRNLRTVSLVPILPSHSISFPGWSLPLWGRRSLDVLTAWLCRFQDCCSGGGDCRISNNLTGWS